MRDQTIILLSVFDGAEFLPAQLESLERQADRRWVLLWRDDGSRDGSARILEDFAARQTPDRVRRVAQPAGRVGAATSFLALLRAAPSDAARYAFCDQDDIWLPGKLLRASAGLETVPPGRPALYCTRQLLVDRELQRLGLSPDARRGPGLANALVQNIATGCTIVMNASARRHVLSGTPPPCTLHDWWTYLVVTATGGQVIFDPQPEILYRQHGANAVGSNASKLTRAMRALRRGPGAFLNAMAANMDALSACPGLTPEARCTLDALGALRTGGFVARLRTLRRAGLCRQGFREDVLLRLWFTLRPLPGSPGAITVAAA
ncbi:MAG TPA: glycosyltransferase family 2 protein [Falsiroseomonas sp.]|jgi:glycosyltransferase involved in cell wall biosynthesis|nr:glycosyltransferase family 2 protein [Falsiroseomonas sp.]